MTISVWLDQPATTPSTLHLCVPSRWTWDALFEALHEAQAITHEAPCAAVVVMFDGPFTVPGDSPFLPGNMDHAHRLLDMGQDMRLPVLLVNADNNARMTYDFLRMMNQRATSRVYFADSVQQAYDYIREVQSPFCLNAS